MVGPGRGWVEAGTARAVLSCLASGLSGLPPAVAARRAATLRAFLADSDEGSWP